MPHPQHTGITGKSGGGARRRAIAGRESAGGFRNLEHFDMWRQQTAARELACLFASAKADSIRRRNSATPVTPAPEVRWPIGVVLEQDRSARHDFA